MNIEIKRVLPANAALLNELSRITFADTFAATCTPEDLQDFLQINYNLPLLQQELEDEKNLYFIAWADDVPAGYILMKEDYSSLPVMQQWKAIELKRIYVLKDYHGKGLAQQMMDFIIDYAKEYGYEAVWLGVWEHNGRARKFYSKYGFEYSGLSHDFPIGSTPQTDVWLWKFLKEGAKKM